MALTGRSCLRGQPKLLAMMPAFFSHETHHPSMSSKPTIASASPSCLSHFDALGQAHMVDVSGKAPTARSAKAQGLIAMRPPTLALIRNGQAGKGDVLGVARIAGIQAAKRTSDLIPLCHPLALSKVSLAFELLDSFGDAGQQAAVKCVAEVLTTGPTGVEMEALTAVQIALLTIYDMCKAVDRAMVMGDIRLLEKRGGQSGIWQADP